MHLFRTDLASLWAISLPDSVPTVVPLSFGRDTTTEQVLHRRHCQEVHTQRALLGCGG